VTLLLLWLLGCAEPADPRALALAPTPDDPGAALSSCEDIAFADMQLLCYVDAAAKAGRAGDIATAEAACERIPAGTWQHECHFRAGEELARARQSMAALSHCARAGRFSRFCITHAGWKLTPSRKLSSRDPAQQVVAAITEQLAEIDLAMADLDPAAREEAQQTFRMRLWYCVYFGTGVADPAPARSAPPEQAPQARTAFALEAARLDAAAGHPPRADAVQRILAVYSGAVPPLEGSALPSGERHGRYNIPIPVPQEEGAERIVTYGGGRRLLGRDAQEDLVVAALEALYFRPATPADFFLPWIEDPRQRVRWTAARLLRLCQPTELDMVATLKSLSDHPDPGVAWNAKDGLEYETWKRKPGGPK